jgi:hypothetical protein
MAFIANHTTLKDQEQVKPIIQNNPRSTTINNELALAELEFLLKVLGNADLKGNQVDMFYNMVVKLQNQYLEKINK